MDSTKEKGYSLISYVPVHSFMDSSFFKRLSELKLNEFKLDSTRREIHGYSTHPNKLTKFNFHPTVNFDYNSFEPTSELINDEHVVWSGYIYNLNTIEEFKSINKQNLLREWGLEIFKSITDGNKKDILFNDVNRIFILAFSDLKKYRFCYWMAVPTLSSSWKIRGSHSDVSSEYEEIIRKNCVQNFLQFFQIKDGGVRPISLVANDGTFVFIDTCSNKEEAPSIHLKNYLFYLAWKGYNEVDLVVYRKDHNSFIWHLSLADSFSTDFESINVTGWERTSHGKLGPKLADLSTLIDPVQLSAQASNLNLRLMKWRVAPSLDLNIINERKVLLLGAGTLGSYVARTLLGWGVGNLTFVDNGRVSYSNPVRQPLFAFEDCFSDHGQGQWKALKAADSVKNILPTVQAKGFNLEIPMIGHQVVDEKKIRESYSLLEQLIGEHDAVFLLMDSRESRWLPTVIATAKQKLTINAALGFDSYVIMRYGLSASGDDGVPGCYYCNDVVAPTDSLSDRTLDQMCTVTRPGAALLASSLAVELYVSTLQRFVSNRDAKNSLGDAPHQIRGFLNSFSQNILTSPSYKYCSACSPSVIEGYRVEGWSFIRKCLADSSYLERMCGLQKVQHDADLASEELLNDLNIEDEEESIS